MTPEITALIFFTGCLCWGFCLGAWWTERQHRKQRETNETGRIALSMPANGKDASLMLDMMRELMERAEREGVLK